MARELKVSQQTLMDHSDVKVRLLKHYMEAYLNILANSRHIGDIHLYDLFCGPGIYEDGGHGSPFILLKEINEAQKNIVATRGSKTKFHCTFNDLDADRIISLKQNVDKSNIKASEFGSIQYTTRDYKDWLPELVAKFRTLGNDRGFAFIDPYGYKEIVVEDIRALLGSGKSEVLLFLPTQFMFRFKENGTPEVLNSFLSNVLDDQPIDEGIRSIEFIDLITDGFRRKLGYAHFVDAFVIERSKNQFFCLFFFSSHILGYEKMLEAKWKIDQENGRGWQYSAGFDLFSQIENRANTLKLKDLILNFIGESERANSEIYEFTLRNGYLSKHANEILKGLEESGRIVVNTENGEKRRKGAFYLSYQNLKRQPRKIIIKLK